MKKPLLIFIILSFQIFTVMTVGLDLATANVDIVWFYH